jgi:hypothetical protein
MSMLWSRLRPREQARHLHHWAVATATTADGIRARLTVDFTASVDPGTDVDLTAVVDAAEAALRDLVVTSEVSALPDPGDEPDWEVDLPEGAAIVNAVVTTADVEVSAELRRLVAARTG